MARYDKKAYLELKELEKSLKLTSGFWKKCHEFIKKWIWADMRAGILQTTQKYHKYLSDQYKKNKNNNMRRRTVGQGEVFTDKTGYFYGTTFFRNKKSKYSSKKNYTDGDRLKGYEGASIVSSNTTSVDMLLTGQLIQGLHFVYSNALGGIMSYDKKDAGKIEGNRKYGREICTLREENRQKLIKKVSAELDVSIRQWCKDKIYVNYGAK